MKTKKLRNILIRYFAGFTIILLLIIYLFQIVLLNDFYKLIRKNEVKHEVTKVINQDFINTSNNDICIMIIENNEIKSSGLRCSGPLSLEKDMISIYHNVLSNNVVELNEKSVKGNKGDQIFIYGQKVSINKAVIASTHLMPIDATKHTLTIQLFWISTFSIVLVMLLVLFLNRKIIKPLLVVKEDADYLAQGNYEIEKKELGYVEVNELSSTLSYASKELSKIDQLQMELISNITHDLKTPLTLISGYAQLMIDIPNENNRANAEIILNEANRLTSLVTDILEISKFRTSKQILELEEYDLYELAKEVISSVAELVRKDGFEIILTGNHFILNVDKYKIKQAIYNLVINGIHYTGKDKKVLVHVDGEKKEISVTDTGLGINEEDLQYIFQRYYREQKAHKRAILSTGIGLSIVKSIMHLHNGDAYVKTSGNGSTFYLKFK